MTERTPLVLEDGRPTRLRTGDTLMKSSFGAILSAIASIALAPHSVLATDSSAAPSQVTASADGQVLKRSGGQLLFTLLSKGDVGLSNVENVALSTWSGSSSLTTAGALAATSYSTGGTLRISSLGDVFGRYLYSSALTAGRVPYYGATGLTDSTNLLFDGSALTVYTIKASGGLQELFQAIRPSNSVGLVWGYDFLAQNASNALVTYSRIQSRINANTAGSETGLLRFWSLVSGTQTQLCEMASTGFTVNVGAVTVSAGGLTAAGSVGGTSLYARGAGTSASDIYLRDAASGNYRFILRWEPTANVEGAFQLMSRNDDGSARDYPLTIPRALNSAVTIARPLTVIQDTIIGDGTTAAARALVIARPAGSNGILRWRTGSLDRWALYTDGSAESTGDAGSSLILNAYKDDGSFLGAVFSVIRAAGGPFTLNRPFVIAGAGNGLTIGSTERISSTGAIVGTTLGLTGAFTGVSALLSGLAGAGTRMVTADASGNLGVAAIPASVNTARALASAPTDLTFTNTTPKSVLLSAYSIPSASWAPNRVFRVHSEGFLGAQGNAIKLKIKLGAQLLLEILFSASSAQAKYTLDFDLGCLAAGASGSVVWSGGLQLIGGALAADPFNSTTPGGTSFYKGFTPGIAHGEFYGSSTWEPWTINLNAAQTLDVTVETVSGTSVLGVYVATIESL